MRCPELLEIAFNKNSWQWSYLNSRDEIHVNRLEGYLCCYKKKKEENDQDNDPEKNQIHQIRKDIERERKIGKEYKKTGSARDLRMTTMMKKSLPTSM